MKFINKIDQILSIFERSLIISFLFIMVILAFLQVILRNFFSYGFLWADPLLRYMVMWVGFIGAVIATREGKHFGVDFFNRYLPKRSLHVVKVIISLFASVISFLLMRAAFQFLFEAIDADEKDLFELPKRIYFAIIPIGFGLIGLQFIFNVIKNIKDTFSNKHDEPYPERPHTFF